MMHAIKKGFSKVTGGSLSPVVIVAGLALVFWVFRKIFAAGGLIGGIVDTVTKPFSTPGNDQASQNYDDSMKNVFPDLKKLSKTEHALQGVANQQDIAMRGWWGTDEQLLFKSLQGLNVDDLKYVYKAFGMREESALFVTTFTGDLFRWYMAELDSDELAAMKNIWSVTGLWL